MDETWEEAQVRPRESEPNPTQDRIGGGEDAPVDVSWDDERFGDTPDVTEAGPEAGEQEA